MHFSDGGSQVRPRAYVTVLLVMSIADAVAITECVQRRVGFSNDR